MDADHDSSDAESPNIKEVKDKKDSEVADNNANSLNEKNTGSNDLTLDSEDNTQDPSGKSDNIEES